MKKTLNLMFVLATLLLGGISTNNPIEVSALDEAKRVETGLSFEDGNTTYDTSKALVSNPKTYEAVIQLPTSLEKRAGIIFGNFGPDATTACYSFEVQWDSTNKKAFPKLYYDVNNVGNTNPNPVNIEFKNVDVRSSNFIHLAITHDTTYQSNGTSQYTIAKCYINGVLKQTINKTVDNNIKNYYGTYDFVPSAKGRVGGDLRGNNVQYFKGNIKSLQVYSDVRTEQEVLSDYQRFLQAPVDSNLLAAYNFTQEGKNYLKDLSNNGYDLMCSDDVLSLYPEKDGLMFDADSRNTIKKKLETIPNTVEAEIFIPKEISGRAGVILGNYGTGKSFSFEINPNGTPRLYYTAKEDELDKSIVFTGADVRTGDWAHLAITHEETTKKVNCYINGALVGSSDMYFNYHDLISNEVFNIGGDNRSGNEQYFKGLIKSVTAYSDVRSAEEILSDSKNGTNLNDDNLILHHKLSKSDEGKDVEDLTGNGYMAHYQTTWFEEKDPVSEYAYSFAVVGDTQIICEKDPDGMKKIYDWIVDNKESKNIKHVFGLGDITNGNSVAEWIAAKAAVSKLDGVIPYSLVRGNHDGTDYFNGVFDYYAYTSQFNGFYQEGCIDNSYKTMTIGDVDYLFITLDYGASDAELDWAGSVIEQYPQHQVVLSTHAYMYRDGTTLGPNDVCPPADSNDANYSPNKGYNNGDQMWDKLVSKYGNIVLVLSGHDPCENVVTRQEAGVHGNIVTQMLIDPQGMDAAMGSTGMVAMLYFSEDGKQMEVEFYSTIRNKFFKESNQYKVDLSNMGTNAHNYEHQFDDNHHYEKCACGSIINKEEHVWDNGEVTKESTCTEVGIKTYKCECGASRNENLVMKDHKYEYAFNQNEHWKECSCGDIEGEKEEHSYKVSTKQPTETEEGLNTYTCKCGSTYTEVIDKLPPSKKGCKGGIATSAFGLITIAGALMFLRKKK